MTEEIGNSELLRTWANDGTVVVPPNTKIDEGWLRGEQPPHEWMNYIHNALGQKLNHALSRGTADWNSETEYLVGATVNHSGLVWMALATSTNSEPSASNANWTMLYTRATILGTVSQSGGVPTGEVIQRGSNANGEFVRFADGTQIVGQPFTFNFGADRGERTPELPFPAAFSVRPALAGASVVPPIASEGGPNASRLGAFLAMDRDATASVGRIISPADFNNAWNNLRINNTHDSWQAVYIGSWY